MRVQDVFNDTRSILEPAGAVALAGAKAYLQRYNVKVR
jgi:threonine dehydratase